MSRHSEGNLPGEGDQFGFSVALSDDGNTLAVGAPSEDSSANGINGNQKDESALTAGAVYVYSRSGTAWMQQAYVKSEATPMATAGDQFGYSVALNADGNTLAVGVYDEGGSGRSVNAPIDAMRRHGVAIAIASDSNPGSSPAGSLLLMLNMACTLFRLTPEEALAGVTRNAARALGIAGDHGTLAVGKVADLVIWDIDHPAELSYWLGGNPAHLVVRGGQIVAGPGAS